MTTKDADHCKSAFFDIAGSETGVPLTWRFFVPILVAAVVFVLFNFLPLEKYGDNTALGLAFLTASIVLMISLPVNIAICGLIIAVGGVILGFWNYGDVGAVFGGSSFLSIFGMLIVSMGCEYTPFGRRMAYVVLRRFGQKSSRMVLVLAVVTACISALVSNVAVIIIMSSVCAELLQTMGQKPGESHIGKTIMLIIPMAAIVGGIVLINGSPTGNTMAISFLENASGGRFSVSYGQWAYFGISCFVVTIIPISLVYMKCCGLKHSNVVMPPSEYYEQLLRELGPLSSAEIRWLLTVTGMVASMLCGVKPGLAALGFACISMLPGIGTVPADKAIKKLPLHVMIASGFVPLLAKLFSETGLGHCIGDWIGPLIQGLGPLGLSIVSALLMGTLVNVFVNANLAVLALVMGVITPVCIKLGYNPEVVLIPSMFLASFFFVMGAHNIMLLNKGYGYWEIRDPMLPGTIVVLLCAVIFPIICCCIAPLLGMSIYILG